MFKKFLDLFRHKEKEVEPTGRRERKIDNETLISLKSRWRSMMLSCYDPKCKNFRLYGDKGIKVCERWKDFSNYLEDFKDCDLMTKSLSRKDKTKDFCPENLELKKLNDLLTSSSSLKKAPKLNITFLKSPKVKAEKTEEKEEIRVGDSFGNRTVIKKFPGNSFIGVRCRCGLESVVSSYNLKHGLSNSCASCAKFGRKPSLHLKAGDKFGKYIVVCKPDIKRNEYLCKCECGSEKIIRAGQLNAKKGAFGCRRCASKKIQADIKIREEQRSVPGTPNGKIPVFEGAVIGKWTIIKCLSATRCITRCECGIEKELHTHNLLYGKTKSCGKCNLAKARAVHTEINRTIFYSKGDKIGKYTVIGQPDITKNEYMCKCECGTEKIIRASNLSNASEGLCCIECSYKVRFKKVKEKEEQKHIIETIKETKETKVFEKLPEKLNIIIPRTDELNAYIKQAEDLLSRTADIHFENKFKTQNGWLILYWCKDERSNVFRLMAAETNQVSDIPIKPAQSLISCDLRIKMRACSNCIKEFLELYEMHLSDYLEGKNNDN